MNVFQFRTPGWFSTGFLIGLAWWAQVTAQTPSKPLIVKQDFGAKLDRFGLFTSTAGGQMVKIFLDEVTYSRGR